MGDELTWLKSTFSAESNCVEWALSPDGQQVLVRNSRDPETHLVFTVPEWRAFNLGAQAGETELPG